jgi:hypothetical protein
MMSVYSYLLIVLLCSSLVCAYSDVMTVSCNVLASNHSMLSNLSSINQSYILILNNNANLTNNHIFTIQDLTKIFLEKLERLAW